jgi:glutamate decarboxylase
MIAPFIDPDLLWDFRLPRVASINTSGHKYGRVYPGVGWAIWREQEALPEDLVFRVNYLGGDMPTFALNFSRPGAQIVAQYYNFLRLGFEGYRRVQQECRDMATYVSGAIAELGPFELITDGSELPVFAFKVREEVDTFSAYDVSSGMRERGWQVPAYSFPENREDLVALRVVVRNGYSRDPADLFIDDLKRLLGRLEKQGSPAHDEAYTSFSH